MATVLLLKSRIWDAATTNILGMASRMPFQNATAPAETAANNCEMPITTVATTAAPAARARNHVAKDMKNGMIPVTMDVKALAMLSPRSLKKVTNALPVMETMLFMSLKVE